MDAYLMPFARFAGRAFNFDGRTTPTDYWRVMPTLWAALMLLIWWDMRVLWATLSAFETPSLNPLTYPSFLFFGLTLIPRASLNLRRLHDTNRSEFLALLPMLGFLGAAVAVCAIWGAMMNSAMTGSENAPDDLSNIFYPVVIYFAAPDVFWNEVFAIVKTVNSTESGTIGTLLAEMYAHNGAVDVRRESHDVTRVIEGDTGHTYGLVLIWTGLVLVPIGLFAAHIFFCALTTYPRDNAYGEAELSELEYSKKESDGTNVLAAYAHLYEATKEEAERRNAQRQMECRTLYQPRVLGQVD